MRVETDSLDARSRVLATLALVGAAIALQSVPALAAALALALGATLWRRRSVPFRRLLQVEGFMLVLLLTLPFSTPGAPLFTLGALTASSEGMLLAAAIVLRVNTCVLIVLCLLGPVDSIRLGHALAGLGAPLRLVHLLLFTARYIAMFRTETDRLTEAMRARAFVAGPNRHTWRTYGNLTGMMLVRSLERAERVNEAMRCRAFRGRFPLVNHEKFGLADAALGAAAAVICVFLLTAEHFA